MVFSIILPIYNVEKYLAECVESVLRQTFKDYELILVDDGSTDGSPELCDELKTKDERIQVIHKKNGGLSDARNAGTQIARGEYIIYIDSDDFILTDDFLEKVYQKTESNPDIIWYKYVKYFDGTKKIDNCKFSYSEIIGENKYPIQVKKLVEADAFYGMAWIKAIRRKVIVDNNIEFEVGLLGEDMEWNYHIIHNSNSMELIDEPFLAYRQREGSITATHKIKNLTDFIYILEKWSKKVTDEVTDKELQWALYGSLAKYYSNLLIVYARLQDNEKKKQKERIKRMSWILKYSLSRRPQTVKRIYQLCGFEITIMALQILDRIK